MKSRLIAVLIGIALLTAAACVTAVFLFILPPQPLPPLSDLLARADDSLARSYREEAVRAVFQAGRAAVTAEETLQVLKRYYLLARSSGDFTPFRDYALQAWKRHPGNAALGQAAFYACLRAHDPAAAESIGRTLSPLPAVRSLRAELLLENPDSPDDPALAAVPLYSRSRSLALRPDPAQFITAGRELDDARYYLDAALLSLGQGNVRAAQEIASRYLLVPEFDEPAGLIAYDFGDFRTAAARLTSAARRAGNRPDAWILAGDGLLAAGDTAGAAAVYSQAVRTQRDYSSYPYLVLARLAVAREREDEALRLLEEARVIFPTDKKLITRYADLAYARGEREKAVRALSSYLGSYPDDAEIQFLYLTYEADTLSTERLLTRLREYYFTHPDNEAAARLLVAALLGDRNGAGVRTILLHFHERHPDVQHAWFASAQGLLEAWNGDMEKAIDRLGEAVRLDDGFTARYNLAVALIADSRTAEAETDLRRALEFLKDRPGDRRRAALAYTRLATVYAAQGDTAEARRALTAALRFDPGNAEAFRLRRSLTVPRSR